MQADSGTQIIKAPWRLLLQAFSLLCLTLGIIGAFLPGLPTTVFILMAAWAAARSSPKLSQRLESHPLSGPMIINWRNGGYVSRKAKKAATISMFFCAVVMFLVNMNGWFIAFAQINMLLVLIWLWLRPEPPPE